MQPTRDCTKTSRLRPSADGFVPAWSCSRRGLPGHPHYCRCRWSFTPPFHHHRLHPIPSPKGRGLRGEGAVCFCGPVPAGSLLTESCPPRMLSGAVLYGVRTFLDPANVGPRSPNRPEEALSYTQANRASTSAAGSQTILLKKKWRVDNFVKNFIGVFHKRH